MKGRTIADVNYDDGCKVIYDDGYWGMFRFSGTEKIIRVYAEMKNKKLVLENGTVFEGYGFGADRDAGLRQPEYERVRAVLMRLKTNLHVYPPKMYCVLFPW